MGIKAGMCRVNLIFPEPALTCERDNPMRCRVWRSASTNTDGTLFFSDVAANTIYKWREGTALVHLRPAGYTGPLDKKSLKGVWGEHAYVFVGIPNTVYYTYRRAGGSQRAGTGCSEPASLVCSR